jgi:hypothetical protein
MSTVFHSNPPVSNPHAHLYEAMVHLGGGRFRGLLPAFRSRDGSITEALVLFDDASGVHQSTMALHVSEVRARTVRQRIESKRAEYEAYAEKAALFVLRQFSSGASQ